MTSSLKADAIIIGAGVAALSTALSIKHRNVLLISPKNHPESASTFWAQGGIAAAIGVDDYPELHAIDTLAAGAGLSDPHVVTAITNAAPGAIDWLMQQKLSFDCSEAGKLILGLEAAHQRRRIVHAAGDQVGRELLRSLTRAVAAMKNITHITGTLTGILMSDESRVSGVIVEATDGRKQKFESPITVIATGGIGGLFQHATNPSTLCGRGLVLAGLSGAELIDLEFIQFHPTALAIPHQHRLPLLTEALRGEGGIVHDESRHEFLYDIDPRGALAPRHVVSRGIANHLNRGHKVFLNIQHLNEKIEKFFPQVAAICRAASIDPTKSPLPIVPACHYHMGGIRTALDGSTSRAGLFAVGEVACTGFHGANRLASNSLLEGVVIGKACGEVIDGTEIHSVASTTAIRPSWCSDIALKELQKQCTATLGIIRDGASLDGLGKIVVGESEALLVKAIARAALERTESRGAHYRSDYVHEDETIYRQIVSFSSNTEITMSDLVISSATLENPTAQRQQKLSYANTILGDCRTRRDRNLRP